MSYKYNEKAIVLNHKNLIRLWDVAYDGYNGGKVRMRHSALHVQLQPAWDIHKIF